MVKVNNITKAYRKRKSKEKIRAVNGLSFSVKAGEVLGLLGPNGAGKTTTIKMICGLLIPDAGNIFIKGIDNQKHRLKALSHISAVLEGNRNLYWRLTVRENMEYFAGNRGVSQKNFASQVDYLLRKFRLEEKENELVNRLSRGMQQKLAIAVAMLADSKVILLDEPTLGLDVGTRHEVRELLKSIAEVDNRTIIISTHDMEVVQDLCERVIIISDGEIVADDQVSNLLRLFDARAYSISLEGHLNEHQLNKLKNKFPMFNYLPASNHSILEVSFSYSKQIYDLFDMLKHEGVLIESIDRGTLNFEQVFIKLIKGEKTNEALAQSI